VKAERSRHVVLVAPPAIEQAGAVWEHLGPNSVLVCGDYEQALQWADAAPPDRRAHAVTGLARAAALLKEGRVDLLCGAVADLAALVAQSALKLDAFDTIVLAWPEAFVAELDTLLTEAPDARRVILSWNPAALTDFIERHARRAEIVGPLSLDVTGQPLGPVAQARVATRTAPRRSSAIREALAAAKASRSYVWSGGQVQVPPDTDVVVAAVLPTRDELHALSASGAGVVILAQPSQLPYLRSIATLTPLILPSSADRAQDRTAALRAQIAERLESGDVDAELAVLAPLFERHDPALVAGALLALSRRGVAGSGASEPTVPAPAAAAPSGWVRIFVSVGRKDRAAAKDLVGALIKEVGLTKAQIGRIDVKETFSLVDVAPQAVDDTIRRLSGVAIRGRRVTARQDRG
jgi:DbpA RNA binding domain